MAISPAADGVIRTAMKRDIRRHLIRPNTPDTGEASLNTKRMKMLRTSVADPWHFGVDPDPDLDSQIHASD